MKTFATLLLFAVTVVVFAEESVENSRNYASSEWWLVYLTAALSIFTLGLMLYTAKMWRATVKLSEDAEANAARQSQDTLRALALSDRAAEAAERSANLAEATLSLSQRAFIFWKGFNCAPNLSDNKVTEYVIFAEAENVGMTPALEVRIAIRVQVIRGSASQPPMFVPDADPGPSMVMGPKGFGRSAFLTVSIDDLVECWEKRAEIFVWSHIQYKDIFNPNVLHHHQQFAKVQLIHEPTTIPPENHPPYLQFGIFGPQNSAS